MWKKVYLNTMKLVVALDFGVCVHFRELFFIASYLRYNELDDFLHALHSRPFCT